MWLPLQTDGEPQVEPLGNAPAEGTSLLVESTSDGSQES